MRYEDGVLTLHQSDINNYITCPEQFRAVNGLGGGKPPDPDFDNIRIETDAATVGTVLHAVIEHDLSGTEFKTSKKAMAHGRSIFGDLCADYVANNIEYRTESFGTPDKALEALDKLVESWFFSEEREYWHQRDPKGFDLEHEFHIPFITLAEPKGVIREVWLAGTMDVLDRAEHRIVDWKSAGRDYQRWEKQRWAVQPTVYTFAGETFGIDPHGVDGYRFDYKVFVRRGVQQAQTVTVYRGTGQWAWLVNVVNNIVQMIESPLLMWPLRDDHALCGPRWCPIWSDCKGMWVTDEWT